MSPNHAAYSVLPFPPERQLVIEGGRIASRKHTVVALIEVDAPAARFVARLKELIESGDGLPGEVPE